MANLLLHHLLFFFFFLQVSSVLAAKTSFADPEPASIQIIPSTAAAASSPPATIPAFPEQSDVSSTGCPLDPHADLLPFVSASCSASDDDGGSGGATSRSRCCPVLEAWFLAAYSASALAARAAPLPAAASAAGLDMPALPDDSESCIGGVERALRDRGVDLPRANDTCDAAYCFCGVRLRRMACPGAFVADAEAGRWVPAGAAARRLQKDCARPGFAACNRCLRSLNQLKAKSKRSVSNASKSSKPAPPAAAPPHGRECQLMGVTWLLSKNRTHFLPAATSVLRVLMAADAAAASASDPASCSLSLDDMPLAVGSHQIRSGGGGGSSSYVRSLSFLQLLLLLWLLPLAAAFYG